MYYPKTLNLLEPASGALDVEKRRLLRGLAGDEKAQGICIDTYEIISKRDPEEILTRVKDIMIRINAESAPGRWPRDSKWLSILPDWFIDECRPEYTEEEWRREMERRAALSDEQSMADARNIKWTLGSWLIYMVPDERFWLWWDAKLNDKGALIVGIDRLVDFYPEMPGEFLWILTAAGASDFESLLPPDDKLLFKHKRREK